MTAPAAPVIKAHGNGSGDRVIVRWKPVDDATDYNLYVDDGLFDGIEDQFEDGDVSADGVFHVYTGPQTGYIEVYVTALNAGAEESDPSNRVHVILSGAGQDHSSVPTPVKALGC